MHNERQNPFLGLKPYELKDREKLYGRDKDLILMKDRIFSARTTLLFAGSGVGKTSFLNAKIIPELKRQYSIVYHNRWAGADEPLVAVIKSLGEQLEPVLGAPQVSTHNQSLLAHLSQFKKAPTEGATGNLNNRCLLILDQFEEIFQYHAYEKYFGKFIEELSTIINAADYRARVLFSMREEFLGELSVFDNHIPDLFNNYYRLKCPNKLEAEEIIERTCDFAQMPVDDSKLNTLINDLSKIERGEAGVVERAKAEDSSMRLVVERDFIVPPYLQIACQRLWNAQFSNGQAEEAQPFLSDYETGGARKMLNLFCHEKLSSLNDTERATLADAFDFLVTKKGAKIAYELTSLAEHMEIKEDVLKSVLLKLSHPESRILRASSGPDGSLWFELYHDMYGSIVDEWKRTYRLNKKLALRRKIKRVALGTGLLMLIAGCFLATRYWYIKPREYQKTLREANLQDAAQYIKASAAFAKLKNTLGFERKAQELWAEAWKRRARSAESQEDQEEALISWLRAGVETPPGERSALPPQVASYLNDTNYRSLLAYYRHTALSEDNADNPPVFSPDGQTLMLIGKDLSVQLWDTYSGRLLTQTRPLQFEIAGIERERVKNSLKNSLDMPRFGIGSRKGPYIQAVVKHPGHDYLIAGFEKGGFYIWKAETGARLWTLPIDTKEKKYSSQLDDSNMSVAFSKDGRHFATVDGKGSAQVYLVTNEEEIVRPVLDPISSVTSLEFSPDNDTLLILRKDQTAQLWGLKTGAQRIAKKLPPPMGQATFSPDGTRLLLSETVTHKLSPRWRSLMLPSTYEASMKSLDLLDDRIITFYSTAAGIWSLSGARITLSDRGSSAQFQIWDTESLTPTNSAGKIGENFYAKSLQDDNKTVVALSTSFLRRLNKVILFDSETGAPSGNPVRLPSSLMESYVNPDGKSVLTINTVGSAQLWSLTALPAGSKALKDPDSFSDYDMSDDGRLIATSNRKGEIKIWNADNAGQIVQALIPGRSASSRTGLNSYSEPIISLDGQYVGVADGSHIITVWDIAARREIPIIHPKNLNVRMFKFSPGGETLATAASDKIVRLWKNFPGQTPEVVNWTQLDRISELVFSPDGKYLAVICDKKQNYTSGETYVKVIEVATANEVRLDDPIIGLQLNRLVFNRNGKMIVGARDNLVIIWDLSTGHLLKLPHPAPVSAVAFSNDGKAALTGCDDGSVQLWNVESGKMLGDMVKHGNNINMVAFSGDGQIAVAFTRRWIHLSSISENGLQYVASRPGEDLINAQYSVLDETGRKIRSLYQPFQNTLDIQDISFDAGADSEMAGASPDTLYNEWLNKLSVRVDDLGQIVAKQDEPAGSN